VRLRRPKGKATPVQPEQRPRFNRFDPRRWEALYLEHVWPGAIVTDLQAERQELVQELRRQGLDDERVLAAISRLPRERFVPAARPDLVYRNAPLPIGGGQTISQPYVVALMLAELRLRGDEKVLEVGTGSGYQTALLAELAAWVTSVERIESLAESARTLLAELGYRNVAIHLANGTLGWPPDAPYDAIVVSAAAPIVPDALLAQLGEGGRLILPVGSLQAQELLLVERQGDSFVQHRRGGVRFVPLLGEQGWEGSATGQ
jgi:protein-L-isoaspartate(D-aspartate) O-methyltransferase